MYTRGVAGIYMGSNVNCLKTLTEVVPLFFIPGTEVLTGIDVYNHGGKRRLAEASQLFGRSRCRNSRTSEKPEDRLLRATSAK